MLEDKIFHWLPTDEKLTPFYCGVADFVDKYIDLTKIKKYKSSKEILDPCVGYVKLNSWEIAILDTPLFQRLRKITQLGLAYQVYPTLRYSRLEHTIGVIGRLNQALQKLKEKHLLTDKEENEKIKINDILFKYETQIRLSALFHDIGHCLFSHLSENVLYELQGIPDKNDYYPSVKEIIDIFNSNFASQNTNLSIAEIFSIVILGTKKVAEVLIDGNIDIYIVREKKKIRDANDLSDYLFQAARFIAGLPAYNDARTVFLAQLISSGLDADKLDYMSREEHFSGIKIEMDLERIYNKIKLFHISEESDMPKELIKYSKHLVDKDAHKDFIVLGIEKGGQFSYEEFCVARLALYEKIYLHKKVRAAEAFLKKKLELISKKYKELQKVHTWLYLTESITENKFSYTDEKSVKHKTGELPMFNIIREDLEVDFTEIENRYIPFRAFGFGPANAKTDNDLSRDAEFGGIEQNHLQLDSVRFWDKLNPNRRFRPGQESLVDTFTEQIAKEAFNILKTLKLISARKTHEISNLMKDFDIDNMDSEDKLDKQKDRIIETIKNKLIIDIPDYRRVQLKYETLNFEEASYQTIRWTIPIDQIARYYQLHRILAYIYTEHKYCPLIYLASERVVYSFLISTKLVFDQTQVIPREIFNTAGEIKKYLVENSKFYEQFDDILPLNEDLVTVSAKRKINDVMHNLNRLIYFDSKRITYLDVEKFLKQFDKKLQLPALNLISNIKVIPNDELVSEIRSIINKINPTDEKSIIGILPLGSYMSSSSNMMKSYRSFLDSHNIVQLTFTSKEQFTNMKNIILVDDNINTGRQALNIIAKMLCVPLEKLRNSNLILEDIHKTNGEGEQFTDPEIISHLKQIPLKFVFISGYEKSEESLKQYLVQYCGLNENNIEIIIKHKLTENDRFFSGGSVKEEDEKKPLSVFREIKDNFKENPSKITDLKLFLEKVGKEVVQERSIIKIYNQDPLAHCLGYCNRESLVVFPSSVPTMTITALWCSGLYENGAKTWKALIPRPIKIKS